jgi:AAA domain
MNDHLPYFETAEAFEPNEPPFEPPARTGGGGEFESAAVFCRRYEAISYSVDAIVRSASLYTLTAKTGAGKTALLTTTALSVATGRGDLLGREVTRGRVAYVVAENPEGFRMRLMVAAYALNVDLNRLADRLIVLDQRQTPEEIAARLRKLAAREPFSLIFGDTFQALFDGDDFNDNVQTGEFVRRWRPLTQLPGKPAVILASHPVKNAAADNLIPYGGGAILNEIDGNLTLNKVLPDVSELHWQGKLRGVEFDPIKFRLNQLSSPDVKDVKGREVVLPVLRPMSEADAEQRETDQADRDVKVLHVLDDNPNASLAELGKAAGLHKNKVDRALKALAKQKFARNALGKWTITKAGKEALNYANVVRVGKTNGCANDDA